ncbi:unnamed protein product [Scytosiphon promiscuus]
MSYNVPSQDPGIVSTDPPSTPCTGDFLEKLHCTEHGWFLWVGAFCVLVVICGICSCYVVAPALRLWRERQEEKEDQKLGGLAARQRYSSHGRGGTTGMRGASRDAARGREASNSAQTREGGYHHWYLDNALKITPEDKMELGPRHGSPAYAATNSTAPAAAASGGRRRQHDANRHRPQHHRDRQKRPEVVATSSATKRGRSSMSSGKGHPGRALPPVLRIVGRGGGRSGNKAGRVKSVVVGVKKGRHGGDRKNFADVNTDTRANVTGGSAPATARGRTRSHRHHRHHRHKPTASTKQATARAAATTSTCAAE